jgi:hypothetical protein
MIVAGLCVVRPSDTRAEDNSWSYGWVSMRPRENQDR